MLWLVGGAVKWVCLHCSQGSIIRWNSSLSTQLSKRAAWQLSAAKGASRRTVQELCAANNASMSLGVQEFGEAGKLKSAMSCQGMHAGTHICIRTDEAAQNGCFCVELSFERSRILYPRLAWLIC